MDRKFCLNEDELERLKVCFNPKKVWINPQVSKLIVSREGKAFIKEHNHSRVYKAGLGHFIAFLQETERGSLIDFFNSLLQERLKTPRNKRRLLMKEREGILRSFVQHLQGKGYKQRTVETYVDVVKSFASFYGISLRPSRNFRGNIYEWE